MSYCRWSTDDFQCDLYVIASVYGTWDIMVAGNRVVFDEPLPPKVSFRDTEKFFERHRIVSDMIDRARRVDIGLPHDGETFRLGSPGECADKVEELIALGYRCPAYVIETLRDEQEEEDDSQDS